MDMNCIADTGNIRIGSKHKKIKEHHQNAKAISAVPNMIDALIETRTQLTIAMSHEDPIPTKVLVDWCTQVEQALEKAGVEP